MSSRSSGLALCAAVVLTTACVEDAPATDDWPTQTEAIRGEPPLAYVTNSRSDSLSVVSVPAMTEIARVAVGLDPVSPEAPHHLAIDVDAGLVFVGLANNALVAGGGLHGMHTGGVLDSYVERLHLADLTPDGDVRVDTNLGDVILTPDATRVLTTHFDLARAQELAAMGAPREDGYASLVVVDAAELTREVAIPACTAPHGVAVTSDGRSALLACYGDDSVAIVDLTASPPVISARVPVGPMPGDVTLVRYGPYSVTLSPDERIALVGDTDDDSVRLLDVTAQTMVDDLGIAVSGAAYFAAFTPDGARAYVPTQSRDTIAVVDIATKTVIDTRFFMTSECISPHEARLVGDASRLLVVCEGDHVDPGKLLALDPTSLATLGEAELGVYPDAVRLVEEVTW